MLKGVSFKIEEGQKVADKVDCGKVDLHAAVGTKMKALVQSITSGKFDNQCEIGADTTLTTILGRMAAYRGTEVSWDKLLKSGENWNLKLNLDSLGGSGAVSMKG